MCSTTRYAGYLWALHHQRGKSPLTYIEILFGLLSYIFVFIFR